MCGHKYHVSNRDANEGRHIFMTSDQGRDPWVSSKTWRVKTTNNGVSLLSYEASKFVQRVNLPGSKPDLGDRCCDGIMEKRAPHT